MGRPHPTYGTIWTTQAFVVTYLGGVAIAFAINLLVERFIKLHATTTWGLALCGALSIAYKIFAEYSRSLDHGIGYVLGLFSLSAAAGIGFFASSKVTAIWGGPIVVVALLVMMRVYAQIPTWRAKR